jgi:hypothetical protein
MNPSNDPPAKGVSASGKRKTPGHLLLDDSLPRNVKARWDPKKPALEHLMDDLLVDEQIRPSRADFGRAISFADGTLIPKDCVDAISQKLLPLRGNVSARMDDLKEIFQDLSGIKLPDENAESIPLVFQGLMRLLQVAHSPVEQERDAALQKAKQFRDERDEAQRERDAAHQERDQIRSERDSYIKETQNAREERDALRTEKNKYFQMWQGAVPKSPPLEHAQAIGSLVTNLNTTTELQCRYLRERDEAREETRSALSLQVRYRRERNTAYQMIHKVIQRVINSSDGPKTWDVVDIKNTKYIPSPHLPASTLRKLRNNIERWDDSRHDWMVPSRSSPLCAEMLTTERASTWSNGPAYQCQNCNKQNDLCVVVEDNAKITLLPIYDKDIGDLRCSMLDDKQGDPSRMAAISQATFDRCMGQLAKIIKVEDDHLEQIDYAWQERDNERREKLKYIDEFDKKKKELETVRVRSHEWSDEREKIIIHLEAEISDSRARMETCRKELTSMKHHLDEVEDSSKGHVEMSHQLWKRKEHYKAEHQHVAQSLRNEHNLALRRQRTQLQVEAKKAAKAERDALIVEHEISLNQQLAEQQTALEDEYKSNLARTLNELKGEHEDAVHSVIERTRQEISNAQKASQEKYTKLYGQLSIEKAGHEASLSAKDEKLAVLEAECKIGRANLTKFIYHRKALPALTQTLKESEQARANHQTTVCQLIRLVQILRTSLGEIKTAFTKRGAVLRRIRSTAASRAIRLMEAWASDQAVINDFVFVVYRLRKSFSAVKIAFTGRGVLLRSIEGSRMIALERVTALTRDLAEVKRVSGSISLELKTRETEFEEKKAELDQALSSHNTTSKHLAAIESVHKACAQDQRLHLGRLDSGTLFDDFSNHSRSLPNSEVFAGEYSGQAVDVCFCLMPNTVDALCLIRLSTTFVMWRGKIEDASSFTHDWRRWIRLQQGAQGRAFFIMARDLVIGTWFKERISEWVGSSREMEAFQKDNGWT